MKIKITLIPQTCKEVAACKRMVEEADDPTTDLGKLVNAGTIRVSSQTVRIAKIEPRKKRA